MGKAVKKIATVAAIAAATYYGGQALMAGKTFGSTAFWKGTQTVGMKLASAGKAAAGFFSKGAIAKAGLGLQAVSYMQQRKYASAQAKASLKATEEQKRLNVMQERVRLVQERRQRLDLARQQRIQQGQMVAGTAQAGLGMQGTSGFLGATGAIQTQTTANLSALNMASGASTAMSRVSQTAADYQSDANRAGVMQTQYQQLGSLGAKMYDKAPEIFDLSKSIFG